MDMDQDPQPGKSFMSEFDIMRVDLDISFVFVANLTRSLFSKNTSLGPGQRDIFHLHPFSRNNAI